MACASKYWNLAAAGLCGAGSIAAIIAGTGTTAASGGTASPASVPAIIAGILGLLGSIAWAISAYMDLAECLEAAGHHAEAERFRERARGLQHDHDRLLQEKARLEALVS